MSGSTGWRRRAAASAWLPAFGLTALLAAGCAGPKYTVDDGRKVDETLLANIRLYGKSERTVRPAIQRSAALHDAECDKQWELPLSVASSQSWSADERVAWVRGLGVDERLTVVSATAESPLRVGERIVAIEGLKLEDAERLSEVLGEQRDRGKPFFVSTADKRQIRLEPFEVCRGYTRFAPPSAPDTRDYHWLMSIHPLELGDLDLSDDEALWAVLWTQGLSEEGGARMKTYHYGSKVVGTVYTLFTIATGLRGAALAAEAAVNAAQAAATNVATTLLKQQLMQQAQDYATQRIRSSLFDSAQTLGTAQAANVMQQAAVSRGTLSGVARVGATVFDRADSWAFKQAPQLHANPLAGFSLHQKLVERGLAGTAFVFDIERLGALTKVAEAQGLGNAVVAALGGVRPAALALELEGMPLASVQRDFAYEDALVGQAGGRFAQGLIAATLELPLETSR